MQARIITDRQQWNEFVAASKCCNITQSFEWGELAPHLGAEAMYAGVVDEQGNLCAAMLVLISTAPVLHRTYFYAPRGPVIDDPDSPAMTVLLNFVKAEAHKRGAFMLKVEPSVADGDERWLSALQKRGFRTTPYASHIRDEWVLHIRPDEKTLLADMKEKWRYNIRLAGRKGVKVRAAQSAEDVRAWYKVLQITSERDHFGIHTLDYYLRAWHIFALRNQARLFLAEYEGQLLAGIFVGLFAKQALYLYGASSNEHRSLMPNYLLQWEAIRWAKSEGATRYDFWGIAETNNQNEALAGVSRFKSGWGGQIVQFPGNYEHIYRPLMMRAARRILRM